MYVSLNKLYVEPHLTGISRLKDFYKTNLFLKASLKDHLLYLVLQIHLISFLTGLIM